MIHHYTTIDTLALILENRTIRFNRLDRVDDITESTAFGTYGLSKHLFVSCWTHEDNESIPQWSMYANGMTGVRISLPRSPFRFRRVGPIVSEEILDLLGIGVLAPLPWNRLWTDEYIIAPWFNDQKHFEQEVEYVEDPAIRYKDLIRIEKPREGGLAIKLSKTHELARYKSLPWAFQKELRYALFAIPGVPLPSTGIPDSEYMQAVVERSSRVFLGEGESEPKVTHIDLDLDPATLPRLIITLGPQAGAVECGRVEAILSTQAPEAELRTSALSGTIRPPLR